ncbi:hypothetical protein GCM10009812_05090 [Nocardioides marinus]
MTTVAPLAASWRAAAAPMPEAPPVTMAVDPVMSMARNLAGGETCVTRGSMIGTVPLSRSGGGRFD